MAEQWEYLSLKPASDETLNRVGLQGWELVTITDSNIARFKRPKIEAEIPETDNIPHHCSILEGTPHFAALLSYLPGHHFIAGPGDGVSDSLKYPINFCPWCGEAI